MAAAIASLVDPPVASATSTQGDRRPPADICCERGWGMGTRLVGDEGYGPTIILITALGERRILARALSRAGRAVVNGNEGLWNLSYRDWREVAA